MCWLTALTTALRSLKQVDCHQFKSTLSFSARAHAHTHHASLCPPSPTDHSQTQPWPQYQSCPVRPSDLTSHHVELEEKQWTARLASPHFSSQRQGRVTQPTCCASSLETYTKVKTQVAAGHAPQCFRYVTPTVSLNSYHRGPIVISSVSVHR